MDSDSDFEGFPCSQISFCGYNNSQSASLGGDVVDDDDGVNVDNVVSESEGCQMDAPNW